MIARDHKRAFFARPPPSIQPKGELADVESSDETPYPREETTQVNRPVILALPDDRSQQLNDIEENLRIKEEAHAATTQELNAAKEKLRAALASLEGSKVELRQFQDAKQREKERLSSIVEDLRGEISRIQEVHGDDESRIHKLSVENEDLRQARRKLHEQANQQNAQDGSSTQRLHKQPQSNYSESIISVDMQDKDQFKQTPRFKKQPLEKRVRDLEADNSSLRNTVKKGENERSRFVQTLEGIATMVQVGLGFQTQDLIVAAIQGVPAMIQNVLGSGDSGKEPDIVRIKRETDDDADESNSDAKKAKHNGTDTRGNQNSGESASYINLTEN